MLGALQEVFQIVALIGAAVGGGALLSPAFRKNKVVLTICITWSALSFLYLFRPFWGSSEEAFQMFDRSACLAKAESTVGLMNLTTTSGIIPVRDFRTDLGLNNQGTEFESYAWYDDDFQLFYNPDQDQFSLLLNLVQHPQTPSSSARAAAVFLQENLCLERRQVCDLSYRMGTVRATNVLFPELNDGRDLAFNYCKTE